MISITRITVAMLGVLSCTACSSIMVYSTEGGADGLPMNGIPFFEKRLDFFQETKVARTQWQVRVELSEEGNSDDKLLLPRTGALSVECTKKADLVRVLHEVIDEAEMENPKNAIAYLETELLTKKRIERLRNSDCDELISNQIKYELRPGRRLYIQNVAPLFGSANADFVFSPDGTLASTTNAIQTISPDNAAAFTGLLPIKEYLSKKWKLSDGTKADGAEGLSGETKKTMINVSVVITPIKTVYTLKKVLIADTDGFPGPLKRALTLDATKNGPELVQLVSTEVLSNSSGDKADPKAYQIKGSIIPPAPAAEN